MISKKMEKALNEQVNAELLSAYLYLSMEAYFKSLNLNGFATWMRVQTQEEVAHAMKIYGFIDERGGRITLKAIEGPQTKWDSPLTVFKEIYKHEQKVTSLINNLVNLAIEEKDHAQVLSQVPCLSIGECNSPCPRSTRQLMPEHQ
jgi:ferritin